MRRKEKKTPYLMKIYDLELNIEDSTVPLLLLPLLLLKLHCSSLKKKEEKED